MIKESSIQLGIKAFLRIMRSVLLIGFMIFLVTFVLLKIFGIENKPNSFLIFSLIIPVTLTLVMIGISIIVSIRVGTIVRQWNEKNNIKWLKVSKQSDNLIEFQKKVENALAKLPYVIEKKESSISYYAYSSYTLRSSGVVLVISYSKNESEIKISAESIFPKERGNDEFIKSMVDKLSESIIKEFKSA